MSKLIRVQRAIDFLVYSSPVSKGFFFSKRIQKYFEKYPALNHDFNFEKLSLMEEEHLLTKASIPYRDEDLNSSKDDIIKRRVDEQLFSNLSSTNKWREKWGMTKLSVKS